MKYHLSSFVKKFFEENPDLLPSYVDWSVSLLNLATVPLNKLLKHLLTVQGIDPNVNPGTRTKEKFLAELNQSLNSVHKKEYDDNFDFSALSKKYNQVKDELNISKDQFDKYTNLNNATNPPAPPTPPVVIMPTQSNPLDDLIKCLNDRTVPTPRHVAIENVLNVAEENLKTELGVDEVQQLVNRGNVLKDIKDTINSYRREQLSDEHETKLSAAQNLAEDMIARGLCHKLFFKSNVDEIMKYSEEAFQSIKRVVERQPLIEKVELSASLQEVGEFVEEFNTDRDTKEAEVINKLLLEGSILFNDLDALVKEGLSANAVAIWKTKYSESFLLDKAKKIAQGRKDDGLFKSFRRVPTRR